MRRLQRSVAGVAVALVGLAHAPTADAGTVTGVVYDSSSGAPISGATLRVLYDEGEPQEGQLVLTEQASERGNYDIDLPAGRRYRLEIDTGPVSLAFPSTVRPPAPGRASEGEIVPYPRPSTAIEPRYFLRFDSERDDQRWINNHIPVDPLRTTVLLTKASDRDRAGPGDIVTYTITAENRSSSDLVAAAGRQVYVRDAPPRGFAMVDGGAHADVIVGGERRAVEGARWHAEDESSNRLLRFGPVDLPAGAVLRLRYQMTVGVDTRPGRYDNRAVLVNAAGVVQSNQASAEVFAERDRDFDDATVLGRVFCDDDGDGRVSRQERGVYGARVYITSGSVAITDEEGLFHLSRVPAGTQLVKIDENSLSGEVIGSPRRLLRLTAGLADRASFPVRCAARPVTLRHARAAVRRPGPIATPAEPTRLSGTIEPRLALRVGGESIALPSARIAGVPPQEPVPAGGWAKPLLFRPVYSVPGGAVSSHSLIIYPMGEFGRGPAVRVEASAGAPPIEVPWDGRGDDGAPVRPGLYAAQLSLVAAGGALEASSPLVPIRIGEGQERLREIWRGDLFTHGAAGAKDVVPSADVRERAQALLRKLEDGDTIDIEVHSGGVLPMLESVAATQMEARRLADLFVELGVDRDRIRSHGRGNLGLADIENPGPEARANNRRIEVTVRHAIEGELETGIPAQVKIDDRRVPLRRDGSFSIEISGGETSVELQSRSGRRVRIDLRSQSGAEAMATADGIGGVEPSPASVRPLPIRVDVARGTLEVGGDASAGTLLRVEAELEAVLPVYELTGTGENRLLREPLSWRLRVPAELFVTSWSLVIADPAGDEVHRLSGTQPMPPTTRWSGTSRQGEPLLAPGEYQFWLEVSSSHGLGRSPPGRFWVDPTQPVVLGDVSGRLFARSGEPRAPVRNGLSALLARARREGPSERYTLRIDVAGDAARRDAVDREVRDYLALLGVPETRLRIEIQNARGARDRMVIHRGATPRAFAPELEVAGQSVVLQGDRFEAAPPVAQGGSIELVVTTRSGHSATVQARLAAPPEPLMDPFDREGSVGEDSGPGVDTPPRDQVLDPFSSGRVARLADADREGAPSPSSPSPPVPSGFERFAIDLPPAGSELGRSEISVTGVADPGQRVLINGRAARIRRDGRFSAVVPLEIGDNVLEVRVHDRSGVVGVLDWPLRVDRTQVFAMGLAEGIASAAHVDRGTGTGWSSEETLLDGMNEDTTVHVGGLALHGRAMALIEAEILRSGDTEPIQVTAHLDTGKRRRFGAFFEELNDTATSPPVYGDAAVEQRIANSRGKLFVAASRGDSSAVVGSVHTEVGDAGTLFSYDRTVDGAVVHLEGDVQGHRPMLRGFGSREIGDQQRDINWFRSTGGTLYYLRYSPVLEGSERIRVITRDGTSGMVSGERLLLRSRDYVIDYPSGRILFTEPIPSSARGDWILQSPNGSMTPGAGNPIYIEVSYEHTDPSAPETRSAGLYLKDRYRGAEVGAGVAVEDRDSGEYRLYGADAAAHLGARSRLRLEVAASDAVDADTVLSADGGLTFLDLQSTGRAANPAMNVQTGWRARLDLDGADMSSARWLAGSSGELYVQEMDRGFSSGGSVFEQGRLKFGGALHHALTDHDDLELAHQGEIADVPRLGPTLADVDRMGDVSDLDERASHATRLAYSAERGRFTHRTEASHRRVTSTAPLASGAPSVDIRRIGLAAGSAYDPSRALRLRVGQAWEIDAGEADPLFDPVMAGAASRGSDDLAGVTTSVGSDLHLTEDVSLSSDYYQRWNGDSAAQIGLNAPIDQNGSMYVRERVGTRDGRTVSTSIVGAEERFAGGGGRRFGEYQIDHGVYGGRNRALLGLGRRWVAMRGVALGVGLEHQAAFGGYLPDGTPVGHQQRELIHTSAELTRFERLKVAARLELRVDHGVRPDGYEEELVAGDPRPAVPDDGFPEHGGVAPGAPLVLPPGDRVQVVAGIGSDFRVARDHTWFGRLRGSVTTETTDVDSVARDPGFDDARFMDATTGWAYRPLDHDWFDLIGRYSYLLEERPGPALFGTVSRSHVLALIPIAELPLNLRLSGKVAVKHTSSTLEQPGPDADADVSALLALARLGYRFWSRWDVTGEVRTLAVLRTPGTETRDGTLLELGYGADDALRLAAGYNFSRFSDNELGDLERDAHGLFLRITGQY